MMASPARPHRRARSLTGASVALVAVLLAVVAAGCGVRTAADADRQYASSPAPATAAAAGPAPRPRVFVIGDSYVEGTAQNSGPEFPAIIANDLGWRVRADGLGSTGYLARLAGRPKYGDRLPADLGPTSRGGANPDLLVVAGGANDRTLPRADVLAAARTFFADAYRLRPWARLVVISPWVPAAEDYDPRLDAALRQITAQAGGTWVDTHRWFLDHPELIGDDHDHPTDEGHRYIAHRLDLILKRVLRATP